jgi:hypothetical protein
MTTDSGVDKVRLRGNNPRLAAMVPTLNALSPQCASLGSFIDEAVRYLNAANLTVTTIEYHSGMRELTIMVRG